MPLIPVLQRNPLLKPSFQGRAPLTLAKMVAHVNFPVGRASVLLASQGPTVRLQCQDVAVRTRTATVTDRAKATSANATQDSVVQCVKLELVTM